MNYSNRVSTIEETQLLSSAKFRNWVLTSMTRQYKTPLKFEPLLVPKFSKMNSQTSVETYHLKHPD